MVQHTTTPQEGKRRSRWVPAFSQSAALAFGSLAILGFQVHYALANDTSVLLAVALFAPLTLSLCAMAYTDWRRRTRT